MRQKKGMQMSNNSSDILSGAQEVADVLRWSVKTLRKYARQYPPGGAGIPTHLNGRWNVRRDEILRWRDHVMQQENRHPEARRFRPAEAPSLTEIKARSKSRQVETTTQSSPINEEITNR